MVSKFSICRAGSPQQEFFAAAGMRNQKHIGACADGQGDRSSFQQGLMPVSNRVQNKQIFQNRLYSLSCFDFRFAGLAAVLAGFAPALLPFYHFAFEVLHRHISNRRGILRLGRFLVEAALALARWRFLFPCFFSDSHAP